MSKNEQYSGHPMLGCSSTIFTILVFLLIMGALHLSGIMPFEVILYYVRLLGGV